LPAGVKIVPFIDRSELVEFTTHTVLHNLTEGIILVVVILFLFLGNTRAALIVAVTIPFSLLFASICLSLRHIPANLLSLGALDFGMVVDGAVVMIENIVRHLHTAESGMASACRWAIRFGRGARSAAAGVLRHHHHHHGLHSDLHAAARGGTAVQTDGLDGGVRAVGSAAVLDCGAPVLASFFFRRGAKEWHNPVMRI
jgi:cobalt-zinc-cadmium resistance protein CzcA